MTLPRLLLLAVLSTAPSAVLEAQERGRPTSSSPSAPNVPDDMRPPAGKCRIWMNDVAPAQQPAPTDCKSALRQKPSNGVVVFGPTERRARGNTFTGRPRTSPTDSARRTPPAESTTPARTEAERKQPERKAPERKAPERRTSEPPQSERRTPVRPTPVRPTPAPATRVPSRPPASESGRPATRRPQETAGPAASAERLFL